MLLHDRSATILLCSVLVACAAEPAGLPSAPAESGIGMPTLERRPLRIAEEDLPESRYLTFGVASDGSVIYQASLDRGPMLRRIDSTGKHLDAFGREGDGPGELRGLAHLKVRGDTLQIHNSSRSVLIEMTLAGKLLRERRALIFDLPMTWFADSVDHWNPFPLPGQLGQAMIRSAIGRTDGRTLFDTSSAFFATALGRRPGEINPPSSIPYLATPHRIWLADSWNYRIASFDSDGKLVSDFTHEISPNRRGPRGVRETRERILKAPRFTRLPNGKRFELPDERGRIDTLDRERIRHFTRSPLHLDEYGRLWVIGLSRDSTSVDLFQDTTFVGRVMLPCYASGVGIRAALGRGGWLVLECELEDGDWPSELQLYRIIERPKP